LELPDLCTLSGAGFSSSSPNELVSFNKEKTIDLVNKLQFLSKEKHFNTILL